MDFLLTIIGLLVAYRLLDRLIDVWETDRRRNRDRRD